MLATSNEPHNNPRWSTMASQESGEVDHVARAVEYSSMASQFARQEDLEQALAHYQKALDVPSHACNAAATRFHMGNIYKRRGDYQKAVDSFRQAYDQYCSCNKSDVPFLDVFVVETLQARANVHSEMGKDVAAAIDCHEQAVEYLLAIDDADQEGCIREQERVHSLVVSLMTLGSLYLQQGGSALESYRKALGILRKRQQGCPDDNKSQIATANVLREVAQECFRQERLDQAAEAMDEAMDIRIAVGKYTELDNELMTELSAAFESLGNLDKALSCREKVLLVQNRFLGRSHLDVAESLVQIGRIMELQGNPDGSLDLYQAAHSVYIQNTQLDDTSAPIIIPRITAILWEEGLFQEVIDFLVECLETPVLMQIQSRNGLGFIYRELGRAYLEIADYMSATECLVEAAQLFEGTSFDEEILDMLQRVEYLQQGYHANNVSALTTSSAEDGEILPPETDFDESSIEHLRNSSQEISMLADESADNFGASGGVIFGDGSSELSPIRPGRLDTEYSEGDEVIPPVESPPMVRTKKQVGSNAAIAVASSTSYQDSADQEASFGGESRNNTTGVSSENDPPSVMAVLAGKGDKRRARHAARDESEYRSQQLDRAEYSSSPRESVRSSSPQHVSEESEESDGDSYQSESSYYTEYTEEGYESSASGLSFVSGSEMSSSEESACAPERKEESVSRPTSRPTRKKASRKKSKRPGILRIGSLRSISSGKRKGKKEPKVFSFDEEKLPKGKKSGSVSPAPVVTPSPTTKSSSRSSPTVSDFSDEPGRITSQRGKGGSPTSSRLRIPNLSPRTPTKDRDRPEALRSPRKDQLEAADVGSPRSRIVKALSSPFRRGRHRRGLDSLEEGKEATTPSATDRHSPFAQFQSPGICSLESHGGPVSFISTRSRSWDDTVSQITFQIEDPSSHRNDNQEGQWWWGVTAEGLEGWFPSSYVNQAVQAAEGFLSAKSIHDRVKSRPLDFDSEDESDIFDEVKTNDDRRLSSKASGTNKTVPVQEETAAPGESDMLRNEKDAVIVRSLSHPTVKQKPPSASATSAEAKRKINAEAIAEQKTFLAKQKSEMGSTHPAVASSLVKLSILECRNNNLGDAVKSAMEALSIQQSLGNLNDACRSLHFLADIYSRQKNYESALGCYTDAQKMELQVYGYYHPEIANTRNRIGNVYARQGEFDLAMENHQEALRILKECFGEEVKNPMVSQTLIHIGAVYYKERNSLKTIQSNVDSYSSFIESGLLEVIGRAHEDRGSYRMAIAFFEEKLQFLKNGKGAASEEEVAETLNSLGMLSCRAGLYMEALDYYKQSMNIQEELGCSDLDLTTARVLVATVYFHMGNYQKSLQLLEGAIQLLLSQVGHEHQTVAATLHQLGVVRAKLCDYDAAMDALHEALGIQNRILGKEHPATLRTRREIGNLYGTYESELSSAFENFNDVYEAQRRIHGSKHPNVAETLHSIGCAHARKGNFQTALKVLEECYYMRVEFLGTDHPLQASTLFEIAKIQVKKGHTKKAIHIIETVLLIRKESLGEEHIDLALALSLKATCLTEQGKFEAASKLFLEALKMVERTVGSSHPACADIHVQIGVLHTRQFQFDEAKASIQRGLEVYERSDLDQDYPGITEAIATMERAKRDEMLCV